MGYRNPYSPEHYPFRLSFHAQLEHDGLAVETLTINKIREMAQAAARFQKELKKGDEQCWQKWYSPGYIGPKGGCVRLDFKVMCDVVPVFFKHTFVRGEGYHTSYGFWDETSQSFPYAVKQESLPILDDTHRRNHNKSYRSKVEEMLYDDVLEEYYDPSLRYDLSRPADSGVNKLQRFADVWTRVDHLSSAPKLGLLKDSSGTVFAITSRRQLLRRLVENPENPHSFTCMELDAPEQREMARSFVSPFVQPDEPHSMDNAQLALGFSLS